MRPVNLGLSVIRELGDALLILALLSPGVVRASGVVGTGTPGSCTEGALDTALAGGGDITFNCGASPFTLNITITKTIAADTNVDGGNLITLSGGGTVQIFTVNDGSTLSLSHATLSMANGAIFNNGTLYVTQSTFSDNHATSSSPAGAIFNNGTLYVTQSTFSNNSATGESAAGAIYASSRWGARIIVTRSTFSGNSALTYAEAYSYAAGAILVLDSVPLVGTVDNCTFSGNSATSNSSLGGAGQAAGALYGEHVVVSNCTFSGNSGTYTVGSYGAAGGAILAVGALTIENTIVANSTAGANCSSRVVGSIIDGGHNLRWPSTDTTCAGNFGDPKLASLQDNGGPTQTMALQPGSPAINAGDNATCSMEPAWGLDQRGFVRPGTGSANCSVGAYEFDSPGLGPPTPTGTPTPTATPTPPPNIIPGRGSNGCLVEWFTDPATLPGSSGLPVHVLTCTDDNAACDFGATIGDNACTFHVAVCLNVADPDCPVLL